MKAAHDYEWTVIRPLLEDEVSGVPRVSDRRGSIRRNSIMTKIAVYQSSICGF